MKSALPCEATDFSINLCPGQDEAAPSDSSVTSMALPAELLKCYLFVQLAAPFRRRGAFTFAWTTLMLVGFASCWQRAPVSRPCRWPVAAARQAPSGTCLFASGSRGPNRKSAAQQDADEKNWNPHRLCEAANLPSIFPSGQGGASSSSTSSSKVSPLELLLPTLAYAVLY